MDVRKGSSHPKPWLEDTKRITVEDLEKIIQGPNGITFLPSRSMDEVYPGVYIGEHQAAVNILQLENLKFTHVLNVAVGKDKFHSDTHAEMYRKTNITFMGVKADDTALFNLLPHFSSTSKFIHHAISSPGGKILVHCRAGASRSATVVIAYLMLKQHKTVSEATQLVRAKREIAPNPGFLRQLCKLQEQIDDRQEMHKKKTCCIS
ncbi:dual specificity protein phosphatase 3-like [Watersipora subatra]|uniref:dual specificity protein phosphatase 3-like n=1 Tax=Watersipora subatra TaxID=2589382 RepID=UPI00355B64F1